MEKRWWWLFASLCLLIVAIREDSSIALFGVGLYMLASRRFPRIGLAVCSFAVAYTIALTNLIMPLFSDDISKRFMLERFGQYVQGTDSASTLDVIWAMVSQPRLLVQELLSPPGGTIRYLLGHWLPLAFIPVIAPSAWIVAGPPLLKLLLGKGVSVLAITIRYALSVVPGLFYGAILWWGGQGFREWGQKPENLQPRKLIPPFRRFWLFCIGLTLVFTITSNPNRTLYFLIPDSVQPWVYVSAEEQWQRVGEIRSLLAKIPSGASVAATTYIIPHLSGRREIIRLPSLELKDDREEVIKVDYAIADLWRLRRYSVAFGDDILRAIAVLIERVTENGEYGITGFNNGVILLQRGVPSHGEAMAAWSVFRQEIDTILED